MDRRLGVSKNGILDLPQLLCEKEKSGLRPFSVRHVSIHWRHSFFHIIYFYEIEARCESVLSFGSDEKGLSSSEERGIYHALF